MGIPKGRTNLTDKATDSIYTSFLQATLREDTDIVMTTAWATMLFGGRDAILSSRQSRADLHLLLMPDVPFVADKVRMFGADDERTRFHAIVVEEFAARGLAYVAVDGAWDRRWRIAVDAIDAVSGPPCTG